MWPFTTKPKLHQGHNIDEEDRELSLEIRKIRKETRIAEEQAKLVEAKARLQEAQELLGDDEEEPSSMQDVLMMMMLKQLNPAIPVSTDIEGVGTSPPNQYKKYTDSELQDMFDNLPRLQRKLLKTLPKEVFTAKAREMYMADDDSIERAWVLVHT